MVASLTSAAAQPLWGIFCDRSGWIKRILLGVFGSACCLSLLVPLGKAGPVAMGFIVLLLASTQQSMPSVIDSWSMVLVREGRSLNYGMTRGFGSLLFALTAISFGAATERFGLGIITPVFVGITLLAMVVAWNIPAPARRVGISRNGGPGSFKDLLDNKRYMTFLVPVFFLYVGVGGILPFFPVLITTHGGDTSDLGLGLFVMALFEFPPMLFHRRLAKKFGNENILRLGMLFYSVKGMALAFSPSLEFAIAAQMLQALSFGLFLPSSVLKIGEIVEVRSSATAQLVFASVGFGIGIGSGGFIAGMLTSGFGVQGMMKIMSSVCLFGFLLYLALQNGKKRMPGPV